MNKIYAGRIWADYGQFLIYDSGTDTGKLPDWNHGDNGNKGYMSNISAISLLVYGGTSKYWLEVYLSNDLLDFDDADRVLAFNLKIASGKLIISDIMNASHHEGSINLFLESGSYVASILVYNPILDSQIRDGLIDEFEGLSDGEIDRELEKKTDIERYKIILVPGETEVEGVIKGEQYRGGRKPKGKKHRK